MAIENDPDRLGSCLDQIDQQYEAILGELALLSANFHAADWTIETGALVSRHLEQVREAGSKAIGLYEQMTPEERQNPANRERQERISGRIRELLDTVGELETAARTAAAELAPQVHREVQAMRMQQAYGN